MIYDFLNKIYEKKYKKIYKQKQIIHFIKKNVYMLR